MLKKESSHLIKLAIANLSCCTSSSDVSDDDPAAEVFRVEVRVEGLPIMMGMRELITIGGNPTEVNTLTTEELISA